MCVFPLAVPTAVQLACAVLCVGHTPDQLIQAAASALGYKLPPRVWAKPSYVVEEATHVPGLLIVRGVSAPASLSASPSVGPLSPSPHTLPTHPGPLSHPSERRHSPGDDGRLASASGAWDRDSSSSDGSLTSAKWPGFFPDSHGLEGEPVLYPPPSLGPALDAALSFDRDSGKELGGLDVSDPSLVANLLAVLDALSEARGGPSPPALVKKLHQVLGVINRSSFGRQQHQADQGAVV